MSDSAERSRRKVTDYFRDKNYKKTIKAGEEFCEKFLEQVAFWKQGAVLNNLLTSYHHLIVRDIYDKDKISTFEAYCEDYLDVASKAKEEGQLHGWSDTILENLFRYNIELLLKKVTEQKNKSLGLIEQKLKEELKVIFDKFIRVFAPPFSEKLFYEQLLGVIYSERQNFNRAGRDNYQNVRNAKWLGELFLELTKEINNYNQIRANAMNIIADLVYFFNQGNSEQRYEREKQAIEWIERSLEEFPDNRFAQIRREEFKKYISTTEQINKFRHDAIHNISFLRDELEKIINYEVSDENLKGRLMELRKEVEEIEGAFRLTGRESANFELYDMKKILFEVINAYPKLSQDCLELLGTPKQITIDRNYFVIALNNLINNSLEAYQRRNIEIEGCPIKITFDYDKLQCIIQDQAGGIAEEFRVHDKLFDPYVSSKQTQQETGLGLAQTKLAIELQDGKLDYEPIEQGTKFIISLSEGE